MESILIRVVLGLIPTFIAHARDSTQPRVFWCIYGASLFPVALIHSLLFRPGSVGLRRFQGRLPGPAVKNCPHCAETILAEARVCKHCRRDVTAPSSNLCNPAT